MTPADRSPESRWIESEDPTDGATTPPRKRSPDGAVASSTPPPISPRPAIVDLSTGMTEVTPPTLVVSLERAAKMLGICKRTLERERDRGELRCLRIGRHWKVRMGEIHAYLRRLEQNSAR